MEFQEGEFNSEDKEIHEEVSAGSSTKKRFAESRRALPSLGGLASESGRLFPLKICTFLIDAQVYRPSFAMHQEGLLPIFANIPNAST